jgi:hypothetical protein
MIGFHVGMNFLRDVNAKVFLAFEHLNVCGRLVFRALSISLLKQK